ncbi:hypothetical protein ACTT2I_11870 [Stenotrophomonas sp. PUT21]|jgi:hypothetical protein|uniref:hypothetical protein n=1 Tax=Stenotrophomonas TaxID=40323 RepID=UPI003B818F2D
MHNATDTLLLRAANDDLAAHAIVANLHRAIQQRMDRDNQAHGRFSRAYIAELFDIGRTISAECRPHHVDSDWITARRAWLDAILRDHPLDRRDAQLTAARHAADGFLLRACVLGCDATPEAATERVRDALIAMTRPAR